ncbi:MAG: molecular chaperone HtpG [Polyangia bacterium]
MSTNETPTAPADPSTSTAQAPAQEETRVFGTEVQQLLHLMVHSLYSKKEIFLRELISNSSDALDTLRFLSLTRPELKGAAERPAEIEVSIDKEQKVLRVRDTGVGMTRQQVIDNLGTIARSGTGTLLKKLKEQGGEQAKSLDVIGQFGVGFYSAFMVAKRVEVDTLSAEPGSQPVHFDCEGGGSYKLGAGQRGDVGTTVTLHMNDDEAEYLEDWRLESIVKQYSNYVKWPIKIGERQLNRSTALWAKRPADVTDDEHKEFFHELSGGFGGLGGDGDEPLGRVHLSIDSPYQFQAIAYIPKKPPFDMLVDKDKRRGMQLYVRRVFILDHAEELLPPWLRFVRGVVDSEDLPLNVSREILQKNAVITAIQKQLVKKLLDELKRIKTDKPAEYREFFDEFGGILKEGLFLDHANREKIAELCLWSSLNTKAEERTTLADYVAKMPEGQDAIYYITGPSRAVVERSPHVEALRKLGVDVLLLTDPIDEWVVQGLSEFQGKKLKPIHKGDFTPPVIKKPEGEQQAAEEKKPETPEQAEELGALVAHLRVRFQEKVKEVRLSSRLTDSASVLVSDEGDLGPYMAEILQRAGRKVTAQKPILEINPNNGLIVQLAHLLKQRPGSEEVGAYSDLVLDLAFLAQGSVPQPAQLLSTLNRVLARDLGTVSSSLRGAQGEAQPAPST